VILAKRIDFHGEKSLQHNPDGMVQTTSSCFK